MKKNELLLSQLRALLLRYPKLLWISESEAKIEAVRVPWYRAIRWTPETGDAAEDRINKFMTDSGYGDGEKALHNALCSYPNLVSFKRNTNGDAEHDLYILVSFGWWYVGIHTKLIET